MKKSENIVLASKGLIRLVADLENLRICCEDFLGADGWREAPNHISYFFQKNDDVSNTFLAEGIAYLHHHDPVVTSFNEKVYRLRNEKDYIILQILTFDLTGNSAWSTISSHSAPDIVWFELICKLFFYLPIIIEVPNPVLIPEDDDPITMII